MANTRPGCEPAGYARLDLFSVVQVKVTRVNRPSAPYGAPDLPFRAPMTMAQIVRSYDPKRINRGARVASAKARKARKVVNVSQNPFKVSDYFMAQYVGHAPIKGAVKVAE